LLNTSARATAGEGFHVDRHASSSTVGAEARNTTPDSSRRSVSHPRKGSIGAPR
jgi:hypothetical protein